MLLLFLLLGVALGVDGPGGIRYADTRFTYLVGSLSLAIILFDGGLRTRAQHVRGSVRPAVLLASIGVLVTAALTAVAASKLLDLPPLEALLLGTIVASTDAAAVFFLLRAGGLHLERVNMDDIPDELVDALTTAMNAHEDINRAERSDRFAEGMAAGVLLLMVLFGLAKFSGLL